MPSELKVWVREARGLPVMDRATGSADAYVRIVFGKDERSSAVARRTLAPKWNHIETFAVRTDDLLLKQPIVFHIMDKDKISYDDAIGSVLISLKALVCGPDSDRGSQLYGWFPITDSLAGLRGEIYLDIKVKAVGQAPDSAVSVFAAPRLAYSLYPYQFVIGFVEELIVEDDPEYGFSDKFRTSRTSNQSRQLLMHQLANQLASKIAKKARTAGGNAVLGYQQHFDFEGDSGVVARAYGTVFNVIPAKDRLMFEARKAAPLKSMGSPTLGPSAFSLPAAAVATLALDAASSQRSIPPLSLPTPQVSAIASTLDTPTIVSETGKAAVDAISVLSDRDVPLHRSAVGNAGFGSISAHVLNVGPSLPHPVAAVGVPGSTVHPNQILAVNTLPPDIRVQLGGLIIARSVKYLGKLRTADEDEKKRDGWWAELRSELVLHADSLDCTHVIGYREQVHIWDDVCVLSVVGTAATLKDAAPRLGQDVKFGSVRRFVRNTSGEIAQQVSVASRGPVSPSPHSPLPSNILPPPPLRVISSEDGGNKEFGTPGSLLSSGIPHTSPKLQAALVLEGGSPKPSSRIPPVPPPYLPSLATHKPLQPHKRPCALFHVPLKHSGPFNNLAVAFCHVCKKRRVPNTVLLTIDQPSTAPVVGEPYFIEARVARRVDRASGEAACVNISDELIFLEHDLHQQFMLKLRVSGRNCVFGVRSNVHFNNTLVIAVMSGTAMYATPLPPMSYVMPPMASPYVQARDPALHMLKEQIVEMLRLNVNELQPEIVLPRRRARSAAMSRPDADDASDSGTSSSSEGEDDLKIDDEPTRKPWLLGIDDGDFDELSIVLNDLRPPPGISFSTLQRPRGRKHNVDEGLQMVTVLVRCNWVDGHSAPVAGGSAHKGTKGRDKDHKGPKSSPTAHADVIIGASGSVNARLAQLFKAAYSALCFKVKHLAPCTICSLRTQLALPESDVVELLVSGMVVREKLSLLQRVPQSMGSPVLQPGGRRASGDAHDSPVPFGTTKPAQQLAVARSTLSMAAESSPAAPTAFTQRYLLPPALVSEVEATVKRFVELRSCGSARSADGATTPTIGREEFRSFTLDGASVLGPIEEAGPADAAIAHMPFVGVPKRMRANSLASTASAVSATDTRIELLTTQHYVELTPLDYLPGFRIKRYCGPINFHYVRESVSVRQDGGLASFFMTMIAEVDTVVRSHVLSLGGNALVMYRLTPRDSGSISGNQAYHMVSVSGDAVEVESANN